MFGLIAVLAGQSALAKWGSIGSIVGGAIALAFFVGAISQWLWRKRRAPKVAVTGGNGELYRRELHPELRHKHGDTLAYRVHLTRLQVRETNNAEANAVHLRVVQTDPRPTDPLVLPAGLQWVNGDDDLRLPPKGRAYVRLCEEPIDPQGRTTPVLTSVPNLTPGEVVWFKVEVIADGVSKGYYEFTADWRDKTANYPEVSVG